MRNLILASKSPRRQQLLKGLDLEFQVRTRDIDESYPGHLQREEVVLYLAQHKGNAFKDELQPNDLVITADTIVWLNDRVIEKPTDKDDAIRMLHCLSGQMHEVYTGVALTTGERTECFFARTEVYFKALTNEEIEYYVNHYEPYDKAGSYGIQEWIGYIGIEKINGCYFNVMGLPVKPLYEALQQF